MGKTIEAMNVEQTINSCGNMAFSEICILFLPHLLFSKRMLQE